MNRHIEIDHNRLIPAIPDTRIIHAKGERKSGTTSRSTDPAWASARSVVKMNTPHSTTKEIHVAGAEKNAVK